MQPFSPIAHGSQSVSVGAVSVPVTLTGKFGQVWVDNRGATDLLVEWYDAPLDADSFRIPANCSQPLTAPANCTVIYLKRPTGSAAATAYVATGGGF